MAARAWQRTFGEPVTVGDRAKERKMSVDILSPKAERRALFVATLRENGIPGLFRHGYKSHYGGGTAGGGGARRNLLQGRLAGWCAARLSLKSTSNTVRKACRQNVLLLRLSEAVTMQSIATSLGNLLAASGLRHPLHIPSGYASGIPRPDPAHIFLISLAPIAWIRLRHTRERPHPGHRKPVSRSFFRHWMRDFLRFSGLEANG